MQRHWFPTVELKRRTWIIETLEKLGVSTSRNLFMTTMTKGAAQRPSSPCASATPLYATRFHVTWAEMLKPFKPS